VTEALWVKKKWSSRRFLEEFPNKGWSRISFGGLLTKIDHTRIIGRGCRRPQQTPRVSIGADPQSWRGAV